MDAKHADELQDFEDLVGRDVGFGECAADLASHAGFVQACDGTVSRDFQEFPHSWLQHVGGLDGELVPGALLDGRRTYDGLPGRITGRRASEIREYVDELSSPFDTAVSVTDDRGLVEPA